MKDIRVITIAREYGSGGAVIGQDLAGRLGWKLLDKEIILELARRAHVRPSDMAQMDENPGSFISRILKAFWLGNAYAWYGPATQIADPDYVAELTGMVISEAAKLDRCVIVGRGAQCVLRDRDDAFHVFLYGSREERLKRILNRHPSRQACEAALSEYDHMRASYIRQYYKCDWANPHLYHLMVNSDFGLERTEALILSAAGLAAREPVLAAAH
jgi:cytidylate kinase